MDTSLANIWRAWYAFRRGKKRTTQLDIFTFYLERNLHNLHFDIISDNYTHGSYQTFEITDTKHRTISVAAIRDRVIHRLLYDYLTILFDRTFIYDAWSCRIGKGLLGAIKRAQSLLTKYPKSYIWRCDITKFFDTVDHDMLKIQLKRKMNDAFALKLIDTVIASYFLHTKGKGIPIGNLTSQIFTNIYLNELDRYVLHTIKPLAYMRYGDDFLLFAHDRMDLEMWQTNVTSFINRVLKLKVHQKNNIIVQARQGIHFLGCDIYPGGRRLQKKIYGRIEKRLNTVNAASYRAVLLTHSKKNVVKWIDWQIMKVIDTYI